MQFVSGIKRQRSRGEGASAAPARWRAQDRDARRGKGRSGSGMKVVDSHPLAHPHYVYTPHGSPHVLHNSGRLAWGSGPKGETPAYTGIALLARVPGFFVIAKASSFAFRNPEIPIFVIAQQLGVRYVLGGSVRDLAG